MWPRVFIESYKQLNGMQICIYIYKTENLQPFIYSMPSKFKITWLVLHERLNSSNTWIISHQEWKHILQNQES